MTPPTEVTGDSADRVLIALLGLTPQVVTETLWCIERYEGWWPELVVLATTKYAESSASELEGQVRRLSSELERAVPRIKWRVLPVYDLRHQDDLVWLQSMLSAEVVSYRRNPRGTADRRLHVSLAGGRKGMAAIAMQVMERWGDDSDSLTQVLVSPAELEGEGTDPSFATFWWPGEPRAEPFQYWPWSGTTGERAPLPETCASEKVALDLVGIPFIAPQQPLAWAQTDLGRMFRVHRAACEAEFDLVAECRTLRIYTGRSDSRLNGVEIVLGTEGAAAVDGDAWLARPRLNVQRFALLWWVVFETWRKARQTRAEPASHEWLGVNRSSVRQLKTLLRIVDWVESDGAGRQPLTDGCIVEASRGNHDCGTTLVNQWAPRLLKLDGNALAAGDSVNKTLSPVLGNLRDDLENHAGAFAGLLLGLTRGRLGVSARVRIELPPGSEDRFCGHDA